MDNIEKFYIDLKPLLETIDLSVQGQDRYAIRTSIDQRREQTINRDAKTSSGIKSLVLNQKSILKWCLNRSEQAIIQELFLTYVVLVSLIINTNHVDPPKLYFLKT